jgi:site-specific recombinase XerD
MLEQYYSHPDTIERIRASWIGKGVEDYVRWLTEHRYSARTVLRRVPIMMRFGRFAEAQGVTSLNALPSLVEPFVSQWLRERVKGRRSSTERREIGDGVRNVIDQVLVLVLPGYHEQRRRAKPENPFHESVPAFFDFLRNERGLSGCSLQHYRSHLGQFARYLDSIGLNKLCDLSPVVMSGFITDLSPRVGWQSLRNACGTLRVFLRYLCRQGVLARDLSPGVQYVQQYRLSHIPRSVSWEDVTRMLAAVDQRLAYGRRDYAILLLLVTYGLRAREVAALTLDDIDWRTERIHIRERKAGHNTTYPPSPPAKHSTTWRGSSSWRCRPESGRHERTISATALPSERSCLSLNRQLSPHSSPHRTDKCTQVMIRGGIMLRTEY